VEQSLKAINPVTSPLPQTYNLRPQTFNKDTPMDYADATLVSIAEEFSVSHVVSFDAKDFGIYRISPRQPFVVLPG